MRRWENKEVDGRGTRFCLLIDPEDGINPVIRTYGWSEREVLDKLANTTETAQAMINRLRHSSAESDNKSPDKPPAPTAIKPAVTAEEIMQATTDLQNPAKSASAVKTLLRSQGIDVDRQQLIDDMRRAATLAQEWEGQNPSFPTSDERNQRLLVKEALLRVKGEWSKLTLRVFDAAYESLIKDGLLFSAEVPSITDNPPIATNGSSAPREVGRSATSYRSTALRGNPPVAQPKPRYTRAEIDQMTSAQLGEKIVNEAGFREWFDREFSTATS